MRQFISNKKDRNFYEACMLFGEEDCKKIQELINEGKESVARKIIVSWNLLPSANHECVRLILNCTNEQAREWMNVHK